MVLSVRSPLLSPLPPPFPHPHTPPVSLLPFPTFPRPCPHPHRTPPPPHPPINHAHPTPVQAKLLESALSMTMNISLARYAKTPMFVVCSAVLNFDVDALGGFDVIKMLLDMQCYDPSVTKPLAGTCVERGGRGSRGDPVCGAVVGATGRL